MTISLADQKVLIVGRGSGIARATALAAARAGARAVVAGRHPQELRDAYREQAFRAEHVDLTDEDSVAALAVRVGSIDHLVSTASARARGLLRGLDREAIRLSFDTKVIGPLLLAKHFVDRFVAAFKPAIGYLGVAMTNGAADFLTRSLRWRWRRCG